MPKLTDKRHNELMCEAIDRYLELCRESGHGICEEGEHEDDCPPEDRPCVERTGGMCHWCQLEAAREGVDYRKCEVKE